MFIVEDTEHWIMYVLTHAQQHFLRIAGQAETASCASDWEKQCFSVYKGEPCNIYISKKKSFISIVFRGIEESSGI